MNETEQVKKVYATRDGNIKVENQFNELKKVLIEPLDVALEKQAFDPDENGVIMHYYRAINPKDIVYEKNPTSRFLISRLPAFEFLTTLQGIKDPMELLTPDKCIFIGKYIYYGDLFTGNVYRLDSVNHMNLLTPQMLTTVIELFYSHAFEAEGLAPQKKS